MADGFLQFSSKGVAADFSRTYDAGENATLKGFGIDLGSSDNKLKLELNTTKTDVSLTSPSLEVPTTHKATAGTTIAVPAGPHNADGSVGAAVTYLLVDGTVI